MENEILVHHGIKGQKWGIRRFQNADGSLTVAGRKRYGNGGPSLTTANKKERQGLTDTQKQILKKVGKAALIAGSVAAAGYLYANNAEAINSSISKVAKQSIGAVGNKISSGHEYVKNIAKAAHEGVKEGKKLVPEKVAEGVKEGIAEGSKNTSKALTQVPYTVGKVLLEGGAIIVTKKMLEATMGKENVDATTQAYNAYHKKNKIGQINTKKDDEDDE